jgi:hypothetical protein
MPVAVYVIVAAALVLCCIVLVGKARASGRARVGRNARADGKASSHD